MLAWTVTNAGNPAQDFLHSVNPTGFDPFGGRDDFDATVGCVYFGLDGDRL